jgi:hypothetical protein
MYYLLRRIFADHFTSVRAVLCFKNLEIRKYLSFTHIETLLRQTFFLKINIERAVYAACAL